MMDYTGRTVAVTGGGSGIGEACATVLAELGARVAVIDLDIDAAQRVAATIAGVAYQGDVSSQGDMERVATDVARDLGDVSFFIACAGITVRPRTPEVFEEEMWRKIFEIDVWGVFASAVAFGRSMKPGGSQVFIASIAGMRSLPLHAYSPAKAGVIAMARNLATEWGPKGVRVNSIAPGFVLSPAMQGMIDRGEKDRVVIEEDSALGRMVNPREIATAAAFLGSDAASAITGVNLPVDAGWLVATPWHTYGGKETSRAQTADADGPTTVLGVLPTDVMDAVDG